MLAAATDPAMIGIVAATRGDRYILRGLATFDLSPGQTASTSTIPIHSDRGTWLNRRPSCPNRGLQMKLIVTLNDIEHIEDALRASSPTSSRPTVSRRSRAAWAGRRTRRCARPGRGAGGDKSGRRHLSRLSAQAFVGSAERQPAAGVRVGRPSESDGPRARAQRLWVPRDAGPRRDARRGEGALSGEPRGDVRRAGFDEFIRAAGFLSKFGRRKSMNRKRSSCGLKHDAEREENT